MSFPLDDLTDILTAAPAGPAQPMAYRQGTIVEWNPLTAENKILVGGTVVENIPILNTTEALVLAPGSIVGIMTVGSTWAIIGRLVTPGTPDAASALAAIRISSADIDANEITGDTGGAFVDLETVGPFVSDVLIGASGRALVTVGADILCAPTGASNRVEGWMSFAVSGATTRAPSVFESLRVRHTRDADAAGNPAVNVAASKQNLITGLNPGLHTFTAKYRAIVSGAGDECEFQGRNITVIPL